MALKQTLTDIKTQLDNILSEANTVTGHNDSTLNAAFETLRNGFGQGGITEAYAVISVTYPAGTTCTCSNGEQTLAAKDPSGQWLFFIPSGGEWIVFCTDPNTEQQSSTPVTAEYNQIYFVSVQFQTRLLFDGELNPLLGEVRTTTKANFENGVFVGSQNSNVSAGISFANKISVSNTYLFVRLTQKNIISTGYGFTFGLSNDNSTPNAFKDYTFVAKSQISTTITTPTVYHFDVSQYIGQEFYLRFVGVSNYTIDQIWFGASEDENLS